MRSQPTCIGTRSAARTGEARSRPSGAWRIATLARPLRRLSVAWKPTESGQRRQPHHDCRGNRSAHPKPKGISLKWTMATVLCGSLAMILSVLSAPRSLGGQEGSQRTVGLIVHTTDERGNAVSPTSLHDVEVTERGEKLQIVQVPRNTEPKQIALVIDSNFNQEKVLPLEQETAVSLLSKFEKRDAQALVMSYGAEIHSSGELTGEWNRLEDFTRSIQADEDKRNVKALLFDALERAVKNLGGGAGTKALVLFAEGNDYGSSVGWKSVARLAQQNHVACYVVLFADHTFYGPRALRRYGWDLVELAPKTGGKLWEAGNNSRKAEKIGQEIIAQIASQSVLEVLPSAHRGGAFHRIKVTAAGRRLEAQTGYFALLSP